MKMPLVLFAVLLSVFCLAQARPGPPGLHQAEDAVRQGEQSIPPPVENRPKATISQLKHDAAELAELAQSLPPDIEQVGKGLLPKDTVAKLKKIEKISKHLRGELEQ